jgi:hypothetical protein
MLGCRTYFCGPYPNGVPEEVYERFFPRIRALHDRFGIPYRYRDIVDWARDRRPARPPEPARPAGNPGGAAGV